ncbi:hypothetical protein [Bosea sp. (in: a-proteobacteria)]|uniref:hypothetical protein n=1 Tax=Bosea sp. (in: a-proteobacteria) TaxID=1871050 RepID=UPI00261C7C68|nr:hypothetical protein [Bosea sp. (in: a-proteobacteria)]MCO5089876.1 hypothetical protein [Bosea sp. (in: a-proteobacteria)]
MKPQFPKRDTPTAFRRLQRKLHALERAARAREARIAAMSPAEYARYKAWHAARQPGSAAKRRAAKMPRPQHLTFEYLASLPTQPISPELAELNRLKAELKERLANLENGKGYSNERPD